VLLHITSEQDALDSSILLPGCSLSVDSVPVASKEGGWLCARELLGKNLVKPGYELGSSSPYSIATHTIVFASRIAPPKVALPRNSEVAIKELDTTINV
jgi:hypothetical protein